MIMKRVNSLLSLVTALSISSIADAEPNHHTFGFQTDVGVPDGLGLAFAVRPALPWLRLDLAGTYNGLAPGMRLGVTVDPINFGISPTLTAEVGRAFSGKVPGLDKSPDIGYDYCNFHLGLDFGNRNRWRLFIHAGPSFINGNVKNIGPISDDNDHSISLADPAVHGWILPTAKIGFTMFF